MKRYLRTLSLRKLSHSKLQRSVEFNRGPLWRGLRRWGTWLCALLSCCAVLASATITQAGTPASPQASPQASPHQVSNQTRIQTRIQTSAQISAQASNPSSDQATLSPTSVQAQSLNRQATEQFNQGKTTEAIATWQAAQQLYAQANDAEGVLGTQLNQAQALQTLGLYRRARSILDDIQRQLAQQSNVTLQALGYQSLGSILQATGYLKESEQALEKSLALAQTEGLETSPSLIALGNTRRAQQDFAAADAAYGQAIAQAQDPQSRLEARLNQLSLHLNRRSNGSPQQKARATATSVFSTKSTPTLQQLLGQIEQDLQSLPASRRSTYAQIHLAANLIQTLPSNGATPLKPPTDIAQLLVAAAEQARALGDGRAESYALGELGELYERDRQPQEAERLTRQALHLAQASQAPDILYRWQWQLGRILAAEHRTGDQSDAITIYKDAITTLRSIRSDLVATNPEIQFSFQESVEPLYREFVSLLIQPDSDSETLKEARDAIEELQLAELENFFRSACLEVTTQKIDEVDNRAAVIYPIVLPDRLEVLLSLPGQPLTHHTIHQTQAALETVLENWMVSLNPIYSSRKQQQLAQQIYDWLIGPIRDRLPEASIDTLVFVPDGLLRNLPLAALYDGQQYLVEQYQVALTPGLQLLEPRSLEAEDLKALSVGLTQARQGFAALPGVQQEIEQIQANIPAQVVLDESFTTENLKGQLASSSFPIVHLATHGQFSSDPEQTFLLTWDDTINVRDIRSLLKARRDRTHPVELLVLSACQTAVGDRHAALGLAGLAVQSGARSTLATLWSVNDQSTAKLMTSMYQQLSSPGHRSRGESLRQAQLALIHSEQYSHPFYWSPFVLVGNWL